MKKEKRSDDFLLSLQDLLNEVLPPSEDKKTHISQIIVTIVKQWSGGYVYMTKCSDWQMKERDELVYARYNGRNRQAICREIGISESLFYQIIKRVHDSRPRDKS
jgi:Mor family transcriptional regulator